MADEAEVEAEAAADEAEEVEVEETADVEVVADVAEPAEEPAEERAAVAEPEPVPAAADGEFKVASQFSWSALEFTPLVWRYDAEPEPESTIDLREPAAVDLRETAGRKTPRRKKARR